MAKVFFNEASMVADKVRGAMDIAKPRVALLAEKLLWVDPLVELARSRFPAMGMEIVGIWRPSPTATDVTAELSAIKNADAHMIFLLSAGPVGSVISKQWGELQIPAALHGANPSSDSDRHWEITGGLCNYEASHTVFGEAELTPRTIPFIKKMKGRYGYTPTPSGTLYDAIYVLKDALERAGTLDTDAMITALEKTDYAGAFGRIAFTPKDDPEWPHDIRFGPNYITGLVTQWRDGKQLVVWPDGKPLLGDKSWVGIKYKGTVEYELPPWVVKYWKGRK
jgi:branched-chain amino acid transport system substrate-binding protein